MTRPSLTSTRRETGPALWDTAATSSGARPRSGPVLLCLLSFSTSTRSTSAADDDDAWALEARAESATHCGLAAPERVTSSAEAVCALRRRAGLTWGEVATLFGVSRRSVHHWASGGPLSPAHEARLRVWHAAVEGLNAPSDAVRAALLGEDAGPSLLSGAAQAPAEALGLALRSALGAAPKGSPRRALPPLSEAAQAARRPPPPAERVVEELESPHPAPGRARPARTARRGASEPA